MRRRIILGCLALCVAAPLHPGPAGAQAPTCNGQTATSRGFGTDGDDVFVGDEGNDTFYGEGGNDVACGFGGNDRLYGGLGDDFLDGGAGNDRVSGCTSPFDTVGTCDAGDDADTLIGGDGDDAVLGYGDSDSLDGGLGYDAVYGGEGTDSCSAGEQYQTCETMDPPEEPAACSDAADNDGDGDVDSGDPGCSRPRDPTEDVADDPNCSNGNDDDGDGFRDYPADPGCSSPSGTQEYECEDTSYPRAAYSGAASCISPSLFVSYSRRRQAFRGGVADPREGCRTDRLVLVKRVLPGRDRVVARARAETNGSWRVPWSGRRGRFEAVAPRSTYPTSEGDEPWCKKLRSGWIRAGRRR